MKVLTIFLLLAVQVICPAKSDAEASPQESSTTDGLANPIHSGWRHAIASEFSYKPAGATVAAEPENTVPAPPVEADPDMIVLVPIEVRERRLDLPGLEKIFKAQKDEIRAEAFRRRLGIASHTTNFGTKHFGAGFVTVFYIPVAAGLGFSW